jgi:hypothetical protein
MRSTPETFLRPAATRTLVTARSPEAVLSAACVPGLQRHSSTLIATTTVGYPALPAPRVTANYGW